MKSVKTENICPYQEDVNRLDKWGRDNNMEYNASTFLLIRYGKNGKLKEETSYFNGDFDEIIEKTDSTKDFRVIMQK